MASGTTKSFTAELNKLNGISANAKNVYVRTFRTASQTLAANGQGHIDMNVATSGYTPLGIIGVFGNGNAGMFVSDFYVEGTNATLWFVNPTTSSKTFTYTIAVLFTA